jgi:hypothetical protein
VFGLRLGSGLGLGLGSMNSHNGHVIIIIVPQQEFLRPKENKKVCSLGLGLGLGLGYIFVRVHFCCFMLVQVTVANTRNGNKQVTVTNR